MTMVLDIDDPDFVSCRHSSTGQPEFCNLELAALLLLNTIMYLISEIPSYLIDVRWQYTTPFQKSLKANMVLFQQPKKCGNANTAQ
jgi:hypothetical protein